MHTELENLFRAASLHPGWFDLEDGSVEAPTGWFAFAEIRPEDVSVWECLFALEGIDRPEGVDLTGAYIYREDSNGFRYVTRYATAEEARDVYYELWTEFAEWEAQADEDEWTTFVERGELTSRYA